MGGTTSSFLSSLVAPVKWVWPFRSPDQAHTTALSVLNGASPFIYKRRSSMFIDEDGDVAHEFYEQKLFGRSTFRLKMIRRSRNLTPQGDVDLPFPRLHRDLPIVMYEVDTR